MYPQRMLHEQVGLGRARAAAPMKVNLAEALAGIDDAYDPRTVARFNDYKVMVVKLRGEFVWHSHADTDDFFLVLEGRLTIQLRDRDVALGPGELFVVPRGVEHCPRADEEAHALLIEPPARRTPATRAGRSRGRSVSCHERLRGDRPLAGEAGRRRRWRAALAQIVPIARAEPGMVGYQVHRDPEDPQVFTIYERYRDAAAYEAHLESEPMQRLGFGDAHPAARGSLARVPRAVGAAGLAAAVSRGDLDQVAAGVVEHRGRDARPISVGSCVKRTPAALSRSYSARTSSTANEVNGSRRPPARP